MALNIIANGNGTGYRCAVVKNKLEAIKRSAAIASASIDLEQIDVQHTGSDHQQQKAVG